MKRDLDLVRKILLACEEAPHGRAPAALSIEGRTEEEVGFHVHLIVQAGLMLGADAKTRGSPSPRAIPLSLTWAGYEFLDASRDQDRWDKAKAAARSVGGLTLDALKATLVELGSAAVKKVLGLP